MSTPKCLSSPSSPKHILPISPSNKSSKTSFFKKPPKFSHTSLSFCNSPNIREYALKGLRILSNNIGNPRYPGFSQFQSEHTLQNSSYCWSFTQGRRFLFQKLLNHSIYNIPPLTTLNRQVSFTKNKRKIDFRSQALSPPPNIYNIKSIFQQNIEGHKGPTIALKHSIINSNKNNPGPGSYNLIKEFKQNIPVSIKSRRFFFYDDDFKKLKHSVSMQRYSPKMSLVINNRFRNISFGIGSRPSNENISVMKYPGPGTYNVIGCFDKGLKGKLPLN